jgi:hypothetical protein
MRTDSTHPKRLVRRAMSIFMALGMLALSPSGGLADEAAPGVATLRETLANGLKCRRDAEFEFIDVVVARVEEGKFSRDMVVTIFDWARRKNSQFPFPYFERAMRIIAQRQRVDLDDTP